MQDKKVYTAVGLMSGTSLDGIDTAVIRTDGNTYVEPIAYHECPYTDEERQMLRACLGEQDRFAPHVQKAEHMMTHKHAACVLSLLEESGLKSSDIDITGFHGQTIFHDAYQRLTIQIGDRALLAQETGIPVADNFRIADMQAGGQGAPLLPLYHRARAIADNLELPLAVVNIGGVSNITYIGGASDADLLAFDSGTGCALINDFILERTGEAYDQNGSLATKGQVDKALLEDVFSLPFFSEKPPKSLDRDKFKSAMTELKGAGLFTALETMSLEDGAATLSAFTVQGIARGMKDFLPHAPTQLLVTGGGRHNDYFMRELGKALDMPVAPVESVGWNGNAIEAQGFAYLAVRSLLGLPLSLPTTTGADKLVKMAAPFSPFLQKELAS